MKTLLLGFLGVLIIMPAAPILCLAQESVLQGCSSAGTLDDPVWFNCDVPDTLAIPIESVMVYYMGNGDTAFSEAGMEAMGELPYYNCTYETSVIFDVDPGWLEFYFCVQGSTFMATQSPMNSADAFPPAQYKYARFADDPVGDAENNPAGNWLDLTGSGMTYSDTRIYGYLDNVSDTWPLEQNLTYFVYALGFLVVVDADSLYYALSFCDVPFVVTTGLFKVDIDAMTFTRIGNIDYNISDGLLHLACDLAEFDGDPDWPGWPPPEGVLVSMGGTLSAGLSGQDFNDFTPVAVYEPQTLYLDFSSNIVPILANYEFGRGPDSTLVVQILFQDGDNNLPTLRRLSFNSQLYDLGSYDHFYGDSALFEAQMPWPGEGWYDCAFEFSDGVDTVTIVGDSIHIGPICYEYVPGDVNMGNGTWPVQIIGSDVTYLVGYFRGLNPPCLLDGFYVAADVNGDCQVIGGDVTRLVSYFRGVIDLSWCPDYPPCWPDIIDPPEIPPDAWPNCDP